jgi:hypothetical protein
MRSTWWVALLGSACAADPKVFVGELDGTDAVVGLVARGDLGRMYVCGGPETMDTLNGWVDVTREGDGWAGASDAITVDPSGTLSVDGEPHGFALRAGADPDGPWAADGPAGECPVGVVVLDGGARIQGVACPRAAAPAQVVPVGLVKPGAHRLDVRADELEFAVVPAEP